MRPQATTRVKATGGWRSPLGQTTTEYVMLAGILAAVAIAVFDYRRPWSITGTLLFVARSMFSYLRTMAP